MRIVIISPYPPHRDGLASYAENLRNDLVGCGDEVAVVAAGPSDRAEVLGDLRTEALDHLADLIVAHRPDAVHIQHTIAGFGGYAVKLWQLARRLRHQLTAPVVVTHHEITRDIARLGRAGVAYYRFADRQADVVHVHTAAAAMRHRNAVGPDARHAVVIPHPVAALPPATASGVALRRRHGLAGRPVLLCFGFVHVDKGLDIAVRALAELRRQAWWAAQPALVVAGEVRRRPRLLKPYEWADRRHLDAVLRQARRLGVADDVTVTGYVPDGEIAGWFEAADVVLLPYRRAEQSGVAQLALAAGTRVLAAPTGGLAELFDGTPSLLPNLSPAEVARAVGSALAGDGGWARRPGRAQPGFAALRTLYGIGAAAPDNVIKETS
ncbi:glycosyltransferase [Micromonospora psammae]|uniref:glycosyltransferase n=1 Tax=Micromonospora sp. CPCC 205556 TaxID=3122398 RepID=UPI002FEE7908